MSKIKSFFKKEPVLCIAALAALLSCFFVAPDKEYLGYIDFRTIVLLYCLMAAVAGFTKAGTFTFLAHSLCIRSRSSRSLAAILVALCFFSSMLITNDVALLTFVPFGAAVLTVAEKPKLILPVVVLQTVAANLGSMLTPPGNPQNIHLFSHYGMSAGEFFAATAPVCAVSGVLVALLCLGLKSESISVQFGEAPGVEKRGLILSAVLFLLSMLVVFRAMDWSVLLPVFVLLCIVFDRKLLLKADFFLLLTFCCFFVFVGNIGRIAPIREALAALIGGREILLGALLSQVISNVPAAVLLSGFTDGGRELLIGVNIGGLGTPIASLASLISLKLYAQSPGANSGKFMVVFLLMNFSLLALLLAFALIVM